MRCPAAHLLLPQPSNWLSVSSRARSQRGRPSAWILAPKIQVTEGEEDENPPVVEVPYSTAVRTTFYCPLCTRKKVSFRERCKIEKHLSLAHGEKNQKSLKLARMAHNRRMELEERGLRDTRSRMKFIVNKIFLNKD